MPATARGCDADACARSHVDAPSYICTRFTAVHLTLESLIRIIRMVRTKVRTYCGSCCFMQRVNACMVWINTCTYVLWCVLRK